MTSFEEVLGAYKAKQLDLAQLREELGSLLFTDSTVSDQVLEMLDEEHRAGHLSSESHQILTTDIKRSITEEAPTVLDMSLAATPDPQAAEAVGERVTKKKKKGRTAARKKPQRRKRKKTTARKTRKELRGGDTLNERFVLEATLKRGGMGTVFKALDKRRLEVDARTVYVAIKALNLELSLHPDALRALQHEAFQAQSLSHPNIVNVFDFDRDGDIAFITMELLEGETLASLMKRIKPEVLPRDKSMALISDMAAGLAYAHERGILHADFKPANVYVTKDGSAKVLDFGVARALDAGRGHENGGSEFDPGTLGGKTPAYATKETLEGRDPDPRDDVYALACVAYQLLSGAHPFSDLSAKEAQEKEITPSRITGLKRRQWRALAGGLALERDHRTPTVNQLLEELGVGPEAAYKSPVRQPEVWGAALVLAALFFAGGNAAYRGIHSDAVSPLSAPVQRPSASGPVVRDPARSARVSIEDAVPVGEPGDATPVTITPQTDEPGAAVADENREAAARAIVAAEPELPSVGFDEESASVNEGGAAEVSVRRGGSAEGEITIKWRTESSTATAGEDYVEFDWTSLTLEDGADAYSIYVPIVSDSRQEGDEEFFLLLKEPSEGITLAAARIAITIVDDDPASEESAVTEEVAPVPDSASGEEDAVAQEPEQSSDPAGAAEDSAPEPMPLFSGGDPEPAPEDDSPVAEGVPEGNP